MKKLIRLLFSTLAQLFRYFQPKPFIPTRHARPELAEIFGAPVFAQFDDKGQALVYTTWDGREIGRIPFNENSNETLQEFFDREESVIQNSNETK